MRNGTSILNQKRTNYRDVLVIGRGEWALRVAAFFKRRSHRVYLISSTSESEIKSFLSQKSDCLMVLATRPTNQTRLILELPKLAKFIWLEKPLFIDSQNAATLSSRLNNSNWAVNVGPMYLPIWETYRNLVLRERGKIKGVSIVWNWPRETRSYLTRLWDYGFHDLALLFDVFEPAYFEVFPANVSGPDSSGEHLNLTVKSKDEENEISVLLSYQCNSKKQRFWEILFEDGQQIQLDFMSNQISFKQFTSTNPVVNENFKNFSDLSFTEFLKVIESPEESSRRRIVSCALASSKLLNEVHE